LFPKTTEWITSKASDAKRKTYEELRYAVAYHLRRAESAEREALSWLYNVPWSISPKTGDLWLFAVGPDGVTRHLDAEGIVANGDVAVREATSAIDVALVLVNHVLDLGLQPMKVKWSRNPSRNVVRRGLMAKYGKDSSTVLDPLAEIFNSIGYELLSGYRNWVTHRGAPTVTTTRDLHLGIPLPDNLRALTDARRLGFEMRRFLYELISQSVRVRCWPFVPRVRQVYSAFIPEAKEDIELPGIRIDKGARGTEIRNARFAFGSLTDDALVYKARNPRPLERNRVEFAGEMLAEYALPDYLLGIAMVVRFAEQSLSGKLDEGLRTLLDRVAI